MFNTLARAASMRLRASASPLRDASSTKKMLQLVLGSRAANVQNWLDVPIEVYP
jgi:hypothetical protein